MHHPITFTSKDHINVDVVNSCSMPNVIPILQIRSDIERDKPDLNNCVYIYTIKQQISRVF